MSRSTGGCLRHLLDYVSYRIKRSRIGARRWRQRETVPPRRPDDKTPTEENTNKALLNVQRFNYCNGCEFQPPSHGLILSQPRVRCVSQTLIADTTNTCRDESSPGHGTSIFTCCPARNTRRTRKTVGLSISGLSLLLTLC
ncbi:hypothetical protein PISMIDRAFT_515874 [Pisolithus microcarpus 441]|uniref:Uncharacterized protein n=1 Tax=Pisolithus microcarpus 441 TaxID=765257 RepID=A0A0D0AAQ8_9AGAM|nr:hypothetical protein PISMIDRAFT_515874 [Pisolithus microcarpus 441]